MDNNVNHWGEFDDGQNATDDWTLSFSDLEELLFPQPPRPSPPSLYQPSQEDTASFQILPQEMCRSDPLVLQTIRLLQHQRQLLQLIARAQTYGIDSTSSIPSFPDDPPIERKAAKQHYLNFLPPSGTAFTEGVFKPQKIQVEASTSRLILRKAIATIFAHAGYTDTTESVLRVMTDITHDFVSKFTALLRANTDEMLLSDNSPFHDVVEQTLYGMGMGGMASLHTHYKDRIIGYHARVRQRTLQLHHQYQLLSTHAGSTILASSLRRENPITIATISTSDIVGQSSNDELTPAPTPTHLPPVYHLHIPNSAPIVVQAQSTSFDDLISIKSSSNLMDTDCNQVTRAYSVHSQTGGDTTEDDSQLSSQSTLYTSVSR